MKQTLNSLALVALFALVIFAVAFAMLIIVGDYRILASLFMAFVVCMLAGATLLYGFGTSAPVARPPSSIPKPEREVPPEPARTVSPAVVAEPDVPQVEAEATEPVVETLAEASSVTHEDRDVLPGDPHAREASEETAIAAEGAAKKPTAMEKPAEG